MMIYTMFEETRNDILFLFDFSEKNARKLIHLANKKKTSIHTKQ